MIRIAGGGVSGLATAVLLARRGLAARVYDRHHGGGGRFAGGWQVLESSTGDEDALDELRRMGVGVPEPLVPARRATLFDGGGRRYEVASAQPFAYFLRRGPIAGSLDAWLRSQATSAGVVLCDGTAAPPDAEVLAWGPRQADGVAREIVFTTDLQDTVAVLFDPALTPSGYAYLFCLDGLATFGVAQVRSLRTLPQAQRAAFERFRTLLGPFRVDHLETRGQFMNFSLPAALRGPDGRLRIGEAAGVQDFLFGLGIRLALRSAALAAAELAGEGDEGALRATVLCPMRTSIALRFLYERLGRAGFTRFCRFASRGDFRDFLRLLQRPRVASTVVSRLAMAAWRERRGCRHGPQCTWCRRREA